ncbi:MAG: hypothetical protein ACRD3W_30860, partial [Terriglobales bacterium]
VIPISSTGRDEVRPRKNLPLRFCRPGKKCISHAAETKENHGKSCQKTQADGQSIAAIVERRYAHRNSYEHGERKAAKEFNQEFMLQLPQSGHQR